MNANFIETSYKLFVLFLDWLNSGNERDLVLVF